MSRRPTRPGRLIAYLVTFVAISIVLSAVVIASVLNVDTSATRTYHAIVTDGSGLKSGSHVKIAGIDVGTVQDVELTAEHVRLTFTVEEDRVVDEETHAAIRYSNLVGTRYLALTRPPPDPPPDGGDTVPVAQTEAPPLPEGGTIPLERTSPAIDLTAIFNGFQPLFDALSPAEINQLTGSVIQVFQGQSGTVSHLVEQIATITEHLADRKEVIGSVVANFAEVLTEVNSEGDSLGDLIGNLDTMVDDLAGQRAVLARAITAMARFTTDAAVLTDDASEAITADIRGIGKASQTLADNKDAITGMLHDAPKALRAIDRTLSSGSYVKVYLCNLELRTRGKLNISLVPGLPAPQQPTDVALPSGEVGAGSNSEVCR